MAVKLESLSQQIKSLDPETQDAVLGMATRSKRKTLTTLYEQLHDLNSAYGRGRNGNGFHRKPSSEHELLRATKLSLIREGEKVQALNKIELRRLRGTVMRGGV